MTSRTEEDSGTDSPPAEIRIDGIRSGRFESCLVGVVDENNVWKYHIRTIVRGTVLFECLVSHVFAIRSLGDCVVGIYALDEEYTKIIKSTFTCHSEDSTMECVAALQEITFFTDLRVDDTTPHVCCDLPLEIRRHLLVIVNPVSGKKRGLARFNELVKPVLDLAHLTYDVHVTHSSEDTKLAVLSADFHPVQGYTELAIFGGDGTVFQCIQGLFEHPTIPFTQLRNLPISIFPGGSGNGIAWELGVRKDNLMMSAMICARGRCSPSDVCTVFQGGRRYYVVMAVGYGIQAETDSRFPWMDRLGTEIKYVLAPAILMLQFKHRTVNLKMVKYDRNTLSGDGEWGEARESPNDELPEPPQHSVWNRCLDASQFLHLETEDVETEVIEGQIVRPHPQSQSRSRPFLPCPLIQEHFIEDMADVAYEHISTLMPDDQNVPVDSHGRTFVEEIQEDFFSLLICMTKKLASDIYGAYKNTLNSGSLDGLGIVRHPKVGRKDAANFFFKSAMTETPTHIPDPAEGPKPGVTSDRFKAFVLDPEIPGLMCSMDGESVETSKMVGEIHRSVLTMITN